MSDGDRRAANQAMIRDLFTRYHEMVNRDIDELRPFYTDDTILELPQLGTRAEGIEGTLAMAKTVGTTFREWKQVNFEFHDCLDPDEVIWEADADGVFAHSGERYEQRYVLFVKLRDGRISHYREYIDTRQLAHFPRRAR